jgi:predicted O-linked N-acetylglucosamine transferase (SPINDLY family)
VLKDLLAQLLKRPRARAPDGNERLAAALAHEAGGRLAEAEAIYRGLLEHAVPDREVPQLDVLLLLGNNLQRQKRAHDAVPLLERAVRLRPSSVEAHFTLAGALSSLGLLDEAVVHYEQVLALRPGLVEAMSNLGNILAHAGRVEDAERRYREALGLRPAFAPAANNLGRLLFRQGRVPEAIACFKTAFTSDRSFVDAQSNYIYWLNFDPSYTPRELFEAHLEWARAHAEPLPRAAALHANDRSPGRRLRVGYVSPNFKDHAAAYFFESTLACHDAREVEITCYSDVAQEDDTTARIRALSSRWRPCAGLTDPQLVELVLRDAIDILVDLSGHTEGNRLLAFARKPAPVQVTWNGYANTTGMSAMDYRITDGFADPPGLTEALHTEKLIRMPDVYMVFTAPVGSPEVNELPAALSGHVTFGSFNAVTKITPVVVKLWSRILSALPSARLLVAALPAANVHERIRALFAAEGIEASRLDLRGRVPRHEFLALHHETDIALDPFPFTGTTTTCHSLWMGVPVVTLAGETHAARVGASFLTNAGLPELVAGSADQYVEIALALARDTQRLAALRGTLRRRMLDSPLMDARTFTGHLEARYRHMWQDWCARNP